MKVSNHYNHIIDFLAEYISKNCIGRSNSMHSSEFRKLIKEVHGIEIHERIFREIINIIRCSWRVRNLVSGSSGYFIADNNKDRQKYLNALKSKAEATQMIIDSFDDGSILDPGTTVEKKPPITDW